MHNGRTWRETRGSTSRQFTTIGTSRGASVTNIAGHAIMGDHFEIENNMFIDSRRIRLYPDFVVPDAGYQGNDRRAGCLAGTRTAAIGTILRWKDDINASPICWASGSAGFGKSAIAQTLAELCAANGTLAASFFFLRGAGGRSEFGRFITTLAFQITIAIPETKTIIEQALQNDPTIPYQSIANQLQKLILSPMMSLPAAHASTRSFIAVIDGLDECNDKRAVQNFIGVLATTSSCGALPLRWLFTSRREDHIRQAFCDSEGRAVATLLTLEDFNSAVDIATFLKHCFSVIFKQNPRLMQGICLPWPSDEDLQALEQKSDKLFIFASTLVDFITDGKGAPPDQKLKIVLNLHAGLDPLYDLR